MGFSYTKQQQSVIDVRNRNVLVSAAAGSGKTAVLVERVIQMVLAGEVSMDELLVVTFTRAAASEMRERISQALNRALNENYRAEIREQLALLPFSDITTIHSFCLKMIKENYSVLGLASDFRIGEESETKILMEEAMDELLEEQYEKASPEFLHFCKSFSTGTGDLPVAEAIRKLYDSSQAMAEPEEWLDFLVRQLSADSGEELMASELFQMLILETKKKLKWAKREWQVLSDYTDEKEFAPFLPQTTYFGDLIELCILALRNEDYDSIVSAFRQYKAPDLPRSKKGMDEEGLKEAKEKVENLRQVFSEMMPYFQTDLQSNLQITKNMQILMLELRRLTLAFAERYQEKKNTKALIDFNDIEHLALQLLKPQGEKNSEIALRYRSQYKEVIIDEYQDTNEVQDTILQLVASAPERPNSFMVGDLKQSIYKFRKAKPEIFQEKYLKYGPIDSLYAKIDMQANFRSRAEVLKLVNYVFRSIMTKEAAGIDYDEEACFVFTEDRPLDGYYQPKLIVIEKNSFKEEEESPDRETLEAEAIAAEIVQLLESEKEIFDKKLNCSRPIQVEDIAVLMRSPSSAIDIYGEVFATRGIPLLKEEGKAYFMTSEVRTLMDYLQCIDNPRNDLALLGVLSSAIYEFRSEDLANIRVQSPVTETEFFYDAVLAFREMDNTKWSEDLRDLQKKVTDFLKEFYEIKKASYFTGLSELLDLILQKTYFDLLMARETNGKQRSLNILSFMEQVQQFEEKEGSSLFQFLQKMEQIQSLNLSFGQSVMEVTKAVRIMSIHKSKGLEFPVVFLAQMGKNFNIRDVSANIVIKDEYGIAFSDVDYENRVVREGFQKPVLKAMLKKEMLEEEQRLLYVALTRAREFLYLVGTVNDKEKALNKWQADNIFTKGYSIDGFEGLFCSGEYLLNAKNYLDFMMPSLLEGVKYGLIAIEWQSRALEEKEQEEVEIISVEKSLTEKLREYPAVETELHFYPSYAYPEFVKEKITTSVSEEKQRLIPEEEVASRQAQEKKSGSLDGALRGTIYHKVLALLPVQLQVEQVSGFLQDLVAKKVLSEDELSMIRGKDLELFMRSQLWQRMRRAEENHKLKREQAFIMAIPLFSGEAVEQRMLQGVIDAFFEEDGELVLLDYKTDFVSGDKKEAERVLTERYQEQIASYKKALQQITGMRVKESYIYSISKQMEILIEDSGSERRKQ
ncbi:MAG: helicase-exonuclease AddAB subunit AddA [Eubacteriales bacterium]|nr:helicase-exonuclease AddAB subunit AddA [Eubacteriales bacterium]